MAGVGDLVGLKCIPLQRLADIDLHDIVLYPDRVAGEGARGRGVDNGAMDIKRG